MVGRIGVAILVCAVVAACGTGVSRSPTSSVAADSPAVLRPAPMSSVSASATAEAPTTQPTPASSEPTPEPTTASRPTATATAARCLKSREVNDFAVESVADMARRDADALEARMGRSFKFVIEATDVDIPAREPDRAVGELLTGLREEGFMGSDGKPRIVPLAEGARIRCVSGVPLDRETGRAILGRDYEAAFLATGWGSAGDEEAFVFLTRNASGRLVWRGLWYSIAGFDR